ncbi:Uncharacterized protein Adt_02320 [Abeliophyllum distichum]|uniref:Uncharacterized protein n=1 Tax=Abeliophyllum distichum TaxID=126358 RepID=A0ABD1VVL9_9LAMI
MSRDGDKHQQPPQPLSSSAAMAAGFSPRYPDGKLRYHGGETRVLSIERSISFATPKTTKKVSPPPSTTSPKSSYSAAAMLPPRCPKPIGSGPFFRHVLCPPVYPQPIGEIPQYAYINHEHRNSCNVRLIHSGSHWQ